MAVNQTVLNWKQKALCFAFSRIFLVTVYYFRLDYVNPLYLISNIDLILINFLYQRDHENIFMELFQKSQSNHEEKQKWLQILDELPFFIFIYDKVKDEIVYLNQYLKKTFYTHMKIQLALDNLISKKQTIKASFNKRVDLDELGSKQIFHSIKDLILNNFKTPQSRFMLKFSDWKRKCIYIGNQVSSDQCIAIFIDTSVQQKLEYKQLSQKMTRVLYQSLTHKFITPLNSLNTLIHLMNNEIPLADTRLKSYIVSSQESLKILSLLIQNLNDFSLFQKKDFPISIQEFDIQLFFKEILESFQKQASIKEIELDCSINQNVPMFVKSDPKRLTQLLFILISNALKYTTEGYVHLSAKILQLDQQSFLRLKVSDSGCGMTLEIRRRLFQLFSNIKIKSDINQHGIGLGLSICRKIVNSFKGDIQCESEIQEGTIYTIMIPVDLRYPTHAHHPKSERNQIKKSVDVYMRQQPIKMMVNLNEQNTKILIVDDDAFNLFTLKHLIESQSSWICDTAQNGEEAINMILKIQHSNQTQYKLIFMDLNMPVLDGMQATKDLRRYHKEGKIDLSRTKIYIHSAIQETVLQRDIFDGVLSKPIDFSKLKEILSYKEKL